MIGGRVWWVAIRSTWRADVYSGVKSIYKETHNGHYLFPLLYFCEKTSLIRSPKVLSKVKNCLILLFKNDENTITLYTLFSIISVIDFIRISMSTISFLAKRDSVSLPAGFFLLTYDLNGLNHLSLELIAPLLFGFSLNSLSITLFIFFFSFFMHCSCSAF